MKRDYYEIHLLDIRQAFKDELTRIAHRKTVPLNYYKSLTSQILRVNIKIRNHRNEATFG